MFIFNWLNQNSNNGNQVQLMEFIKKQNPTLPQILDYPNFIEIARSDTAQLEDYLIENPSKLKEIISFIIEEPDVQKGNEKLLYTYPFYCSEFFKFSLQKLSGYFFADQILKIAKTEVPDPNSQTQPPIQQQQQQPSQPQPQQPQPTQQQLQVPSEEKPARKKSESEEPPRGKDILIYLFSFLSNNKQLNDTSAGYFEKVVSYLIQPQEHGHLLEFLIANDQIKHFLFHLKNEQVKEILAEILKSDGIKSEDPENSETFLKNRTLVLEQVLNLFVDTENDAILENVSSLLVKLIAEINSSDDTRRIVFYTLIFRLFTPQIFRRMAERTDFSFRTQEVQANINVLFALVTILYVEPTIPEKFPTLKEGIETLRTDLIQCISQNLDKVITSLAMIKDRTVVGVEHLKMIEFIQICMQLDNAEINQKLAASSLLYSLLSFMFVQFPHHSALQGSIFKLVETIFQYKDQGLLESLFNKGKLLQFLVDGSSVIQEKKKSTSRQSIAFGYAGFMYKIIEYIQSDLDRYGVFLVPREQYDSTIKGYYSNQLEIYNEDLGELIIDEKQEQEEEKKTEGLHHQEDLKDEATRHKEFMEWLDWYFVGRSITPYLGEGLENQIFEQHWKQRKSQI